MSKRKAPNWTDAAEGAALSLGLYTGLQCLLALLTLQNAALLSMIPGLQLGSAALASLCGGLVASRRGGTAALAMSVASGAGFLLLTVLTGLLLNDQLSWSAHSVFLLTAILCGGGAAGLLHRGGKRRGKAVPAARGRVRARRG